MILVSIKRGVPTLLWYQRTILWACQFQIHRGVVTPLGRRVQKKRGAQEDEG